MKSIFLLALTQLLHSLILRTVFTPIPNNCIQYLCQLITVNKSIQELVIRNYSISDSGITSICQALQQNSSLTILHLYDNPLITSASAQSLYLLLLNNSILYIWTESMENENSSVTIFMIIIPIQSINHFFTVNWRWRKEAYTVTVPVSQCILI